MAAAEAVREQAELKEEPASIFQSSSQPDSQTERSAAPDTNATNENCYAWAEANDSPDQRAHDLLHRYLYAKVGFQGMPGYVNISAEGKEGQYLVISSSPEHAEELREALLDTQTMSELLPSLCQHTFAGVRFVIHSDDGKETVLQDIPTSFSDAKLFFAQHPELLNNSR